MSNHPNWRARLGSLRVAARFAARELRGGLAGFWVFVACIALGVGAIAAVGSVAHAMRDTIATEGRTILGADVSFSLIHRQASPAERLWLNNLGAVSEVATLRSMARRPGDSRPAVPPATTDVATPDQALVELKAIDGAYPLYGDLGVEGRQGDWRPLLDPAPDGSYGALMEAALTVRLGVKLGDRITIGTLPIRLEGILASEPDKIGCGIGFGPRVLISSAALMQTGLVQPGSLTRWSYRLRLGADAADADALTRIRDEAARRFPEAGWELRTRLDASPGLSSNIDNFAAFLTLVGLTALVVGGVGVANAVRAFVERKRDVIAVMKCLGGSGSFVFLVYGLEVAAVTTVGVIAGCALGIGLTAIAAWGLADVVPLGARGLWFPTELALAALYGFLTATAFALWPLGRTHDMRPSILFRDGVEPAKAWPRARYLIATAIVVAGLIGLTLWLAPDRRLAAACLATLTGLFAALYGVSLLVRVGARRLPRSRFTELRLAVASLHRPGSATVSVMLSLGLGLTLLVAIGLIDTNLRGALSAQLPKTAPSFYFLDVSARDAPGFAEMIRREAPTAIFEQVPMLRGRIAAIGDIRAEQLKPSPRSAFILQGDRGLTYADTQPANSTLTAGAWWPAGYSGPPLVSVEADLAEGLGLKLGDRLKINVLGRDIEVQVANLRKVTWSSFGINFFLVASPNTFKGAPVSNLATVAFSPPATAAEELALLGRISSAFPTITTIRVKDQLQAVDELIGKLALGVATAASVTIATAILVLAGALAAGQERRIYESAILKVLGATRGRIMAALTLEFLLLGAIAAGFALIAGSAIAFAVTDLVMGIGFRFSGLVAAGALSAALGTTLLLGLTSTFAALGRKSAPVLRNR